jgi:hypothetical protein
MTGDRPQDDTNGFEVKTSAESHSPGYAPA